MGCWVSVRSRQGWTGVQEGGISEADVVERLVRRLPAGARLHCVVDACRGGIALGLPARTRTRPDSWAEWQARP